MDCNLPGSSVHEIFRIRIQESVTFPFSGGYSQPRDKTWVSCTGRQIFFFFFFFYHLSHQGSPSLALEKYKLKPQWVISIYLLEWLKAKQLQAKWKTKHIDYVLTPNPGEDWGNWNFYTILVELQNATGILENSLTVFSKVKHNTYDSTQKPTLNYLTKWS